MAIRPSPTLASVLLDRCGRSPMDRFAVCYAILVASKRIFLMANNAMYPSALGSNLIYVALSVIFKLLATNSGVGVLKNATSYSSNMSGSHSRFL